MSPDLRDFCVKSLLAFRVAAERSFSAIARKYEAGLALRAEQVPRSIRQRHHMFEAGLEFSGRNDPTNVGDLLPAHGGDIVTLLRGEQQGSHEPRITSRRL